MTPTPAAATELPFVDEHVRDVAARPERVWRALLAELGRDMAGGARFARFLGCDPAVRSPGSAGRPGDTIPGFRVAEAEPDRRLVLRGRHRFASYALTFELDDGRLRATTHAEFPGWRGRMYRALVIGSGGHAWIAERMLRRLARIAQRPD